MARFGLRTLAFFRVSSSGLRPFLSLGKSICQVKGKAEGRMTKPERRPKSEDRIAPFGCHGMLKQLINTAASARCGGSPSKKKLFEQFLVLLFAVSAPSPGSSATPRF